MTKKTFTHQNTHTHLFLYFLWSIGLHRSKCKMLLLSEFSLSVLLLLAYQHDPIHRKKVKNRDAIISRTERRKDGGYSPGFEKIISCTDLFLNFRNKNLHHTKTLKSVCLYPENHS